MAIQLFYPNQLAEVSGTFAVPVGGQLTVYGFGLQPGDKITFEMLYVPTLKGEPCETPPGGQAELPQAAAVAPLLCCGKEIAVTIDNPYVVIDAPQNILLRAVLEAEDIPSIASWAIETKTANVNDRMRGCQCEEVIH